MADLTLGTVQECFRSEEYSRFDWQVPYNQGYFQDSYNVSWLFFWLLDVN